MYCILPKHCTTKWWRWIQMHPTTNSEEVMLKFVSYCYLTKVFIQKNTGFRSSLHRCPVFLVLFPELSLLQQLEVFVQLLRTPPPWHFPGNGQPSNPTRQVSGHENTLCKCRLIPGSQPALGWIHDFQAFPGFGGRCVIVSWTLIFSDLVSLVPL